MIYPLTMYAAKCNNCGAELLDGTGCAALCRDGIEVGLIEDNWRTIGEKHYCSDCWYYDDNDEIIIKPHT